MTDVLGVGNGGGRSSETEARPFFGAGALLRFLGDAFFGGDTGSGGMDSSGSKICDGSTLSPLRDRRVRPVVLGVGGTSVVFLRVCRLGLRWGAGVNSSSSSIGSALVVLWDSSSSDSSTRSFLRAAALLDGLVGEIVAIDLVDIQ